MKWLRATSLPGARDGRQGEERAVFCVYVPVVLDFPATFCFTQSAVKTANGPMDLSLFEYDLPPERIAQQPAQARDESRLLRLDGRGRTGHHRFSDLERFLNPGDVLVLNDTRVAPVRLAGRKATGGRVEALLLEVPAGQPDGREVECLIKGAKGLRPDLEFDFPHGLYCRVRRVAGYGRCRAAFSFRDGAPRPRSWPELLIDSGRVPLPPYIKTDEPPTADSETARRYQTVYAEHLGAVAAPTAGLHFTDRLLAALEGRGVEIVRVTLHVGYGTFEPLREYHLAEKRLHPETYRVSEASARTVNRALEEGRRVVAVGTTSVRVLEHLAATGGVRADEGRTELFITPGWRFRVVGAMITNFHLPGTSLVMLVSALAGRERILAAYREAVGLEYRFYSFGDAMFIEAARD